MLIRETPATQLAVATRILARAGALSQDGQVALRVGHDVVYVLSRTATASTMTPYDVAVVHLDGSVLSGEPRDGAQALVGALRGGTDARAVATRADGALVAAPSLRSCVEAVLGRPYEELEAEARVTGALFGAYPAGAGEVPG